MKVGTNLRGYKFYQGFKLWDVAVSTFVFMASYRNTTL
jgi:hypothetical protein